MSQFPKKQMKEKQGSGKKRLSAMDLMKVNAGNGSSPTPEDDIFILDGTSGG